MEKEKLQTADLGLTSLIRYLGHNPSSISENYGKVFFEFDRSPELEDIFNRYELNLKLEIEPFKLFQTFRETKGIAMRAKGL